MGFNRISVYNFSIFTNRLFFIIMFLHLNSNSTQILAYKKKTWKKKFPPTPQNSFFYLYFMQLFSADAIVFSKKFQHFFLTPKKWKNGPQKLLIIGPTPFISQSTVQNWFFILWNLRTKHLFSYLWIWSMHIFLAFQI